MEASKQERLEQLIEKNKGFAMTAEMLKIGYDNRMIARLVEEGKLYKVKRGLFISADKNKGFSNEMIIATKLVPNGFICLASAMKYYDISTYNPPEITIAVYRRDKKPRIPNYPPIKVYYFSDKNFNFGVTNVEIEGHVIRISDLEKTICDVVRYRNKLGLDIMQEAIKEYLRLKNRNIDRLFKYANHLDIDSVIRPYLEALI